MFNPLIYVTKKERGKERKDPKSSLRRPLKATIIFLSICIDLHWSSVVVVVVVVLTLITSSFSSP